MNLLFTNEPTQEQWDEWHRIINEANKKGYVTRKQAKFLTDFDHKYRCCNSCERSVEEVLGSGGAWMTATAPDRNGEDIVIGLSANCFVCDMKRVIMEERQNQQKKQL